MIKCLECGREVRNDFRLGIHLIWSHNYSVDEAKKVVTGKMEDFLEELSYTNVLKFYEGDIRDMPSGLRKRFLRLHIIEYRRIGNHRAGSKLTGKGISLLSL